MDHMRTAHKDPNASGTPSKKKRCRTRFRATDSILTSNTAPGHSNPSATNYHNSPTPNPSSHPNTSLSLSLTNSTASLMTQMGMSMGSFVMPSMIGGHHPEQSPYSHHPLAGRAQASFLNL